MEAHIDCQGFLMQYRVSKRDGILSIQLQAGGGVVGVKVYDWHVALRIRVSQVGSWMGMN